MKSLSGVTLTVSEFRFSGNTLLSNEKLARVVAKYLNHPIDFNQLQAAAADIANAYREAGWVVRSYLPEQDIKSGIVTIQIVEAVFGGAQIEGNPSRIKAARVLAIVNAQQAKGKPFSAKASDRALLLADDLPGVTASGYLKPGSNEQETNLILNLADEKLASGDIDLDNTGARSTGSQRLQASVALNSPLKLGDQLTGIAMHSQGTDYARAGYTLPAGNDGWRIGANASTLSYHLISPEFAAINASGSSNTTGLEASYPIIRTRLKNLYLALNYDHKTFDNETKSGITSQYDVNAYSATLNGNLFDNWHGGGANAASLMLEGGNKDLSIASAGAIVGSFTKLRYSASRQQVLTPTVALYGMFSGQAANKNLDSSEQFYLGGANGVRAYPANEGAGSEGQLANIELRWKLPKGLTLTGFYDWGHVTVNRDNNFTGAAALNTYSLIGDGLSLGWQSTGGVNIKGTLARRIGNNPNPILKTGTDQDGSLTKNRLWLTADLPF